MKKTTLLVLVMLLMTGTAFAAVGKDTKGPFGYNLYDDITRKPDQKSAPAKNADKNTVSEKKSTTNSDEIQFYANDDAPAWESEVIYYPNATVSSAVAKYKRGNYTGCLQEMISLTKKDPSNPVVYYYLGMAYTQAGNKDEAVKAYEKVIKLNSDKTLSRYALKGRDCLVGGPTCSSENEESESSDLDELINSPYENGLSPEVKQQMREMQLKNIQKTINKKENLEQNDLDKIQKFDNKSELEDGTKIASADVSNEDVLSALEVLKKAGITVSVNPYQAMPQNNQYQELSMMLGGNNNNNNNSMMNMLPYMLNQHENGQNINPQVIEAMMMNSMLPDFTFSDNNKKY